ncbi:MAG TPA: quinol dehydrogenase ferredoxin subunit NapH [Thiotrichales bacterium]|nr:quinol dehydrogenase ferredoxin subunit NapH [Thiotrichales bacterium]
MSSEFKIPGREAARELGWFRAHRWLLARRVTQLSVLLLFLLGPWYGLWIVKGNLSSSLTLEVLPLTDPFVLLQTLFAGHVAEMTAITGALIVVAFYLLVGGRVFCAWVCPVNLVTDGAAWLRYRLKIKGSPRFSRSTRYWLLAMVMAVALATGSVAWELLNPVSVLHRGIIFGMGMGWLLILGIFLYDLLVAKHGWCGHLCPQGAFYALIGKLSWLRVSAARREKCDDCMDCFLVCPEPQVIKPALKGAPRGIGPVIAMSECTNCGRCIDVCTKDVFQFTIYRPLQAKHRTSKQMEVTP